MPDMPNQQQLETNKKNVTAFYDLMFSQNNPVEAIKRYVGDVYIQHNQLWPTVKRLSLSILRAWQKSSQESMFTSWLNLVNLRESNTDYIVGNYIAELMNRANIKYVWLTELIQRPNIHS